MATEGGAAPGRRTGAGAGPAAGGSELDRREVESRILDFLERELLPAGAGVGRDDELLSGDLLDSMGVMRLAAFVADELGVQVRPGDFVVENFASAAALAGYVLERRGGGSAEAGEDAATGSGG